MNKKDFKNKYEVSEEDMYSDTEFLGRCGEVLQKECIERNSSHDSDVEKELSLYATDEQWKKHPLMYELIMGDGLDDDMLELAITQPFYVGDSVFKMERADKNEIKITKVSK